jgi:hypothetical protein
MKLNREMITPYLGAIFIVVSVTGMLMFFHLPDNYTNVVRELLGLTFSSFAILHIIERFFGQYLPNSIAW